MRGPCLGCTPETGRCAEPNCHMTCEKYLAYKAAKAEEDEIIHEAKNIERIGDQIESNRIKAVIKERRRKK